MPSTLPPRQWRSSTLRRTLQPISRRSVSSGARRVWALGLRLVREVPHELPTPASWCHLLQANSLPCHLRHTLTPILTRTLAVDKKHGPTWHVVVGRNFGSYVTHEVRGWETAVPCAPCCCAFTPPSPFSPLFACSIHNFAHLSLCLAPSPHSPRPSLRSPSLRPAD
jgi:hypothetical protein